MCAMARLLLHVCCAHCAAYCIRHWQSCGHEVTCYWYNPNIHPRQEYDSRLQAMIVVAESSGVPLVISDAYDSPRYFEAIRAVSQCIGATSKPARCEACFRLRLSQSARKAKALGIGALTTTLAISPQQDQPLIRKVGEETAASAKISFLYEDLRKRYSDSRHITKKMPIYRQQYCGCMYSEWDRYVEHE